MTRYKTTVLICGLPTSAGNVYPREVVEVAVAAAQSKIQKGLMYGWLGSTAKLENMSHRVTKLELNGDRLEAEIEPLNTAMGKLLADSMAVAAQNPGVVALPFHLSSFGSVEPRADGTTEVVGFKIDALTASLHDGQVRTE
jgi:hypothetical protein